MDTFAIISDILEQILDLEPASVTPQSYVIRDLEAESIDLLEIGVAMEQRFGIPIVDDVLFLKNLRTVLAGAQTRGLADMAALAQAYPHLAEERLLDILADLDGGPVLQIRDLVAYAYHHHQPGKHA